MNLTNFFSTLCIALLIWSCGDKETDDPNPTDLPRLNISSITLFEGDENNVFSFKIATSAAFDQAIKVDYTTEEVTAAEGTDFVSNSGTITIAPTEREAFIEVEIVGDTIKESDEVFKLVLSNPVNATIFESEGIGTIRNDDTFIFVPEDGYITPDNYTGYSLAWADEFEGTSINTSDWTHELGNSGWGNNEWQYYTNRTENSFISDGSLVIEAKEENYNGANYTSARMITQNKQLFRFGRIDIRAILPEGQGIWPALWMLGTNISDIGWPACGEIDIMELVGHEPGKIHGTAHWGAQGQGYSNNAGNAYQLQSGKFSDEYHVFSIIWEPDQMTWMVDDNVYFVLGNADIQESYPFNEEFFFIFNIAVGGNWPGYPDASTQFPQRMIVDYIRVFEKN
ncbi:MAG: family 16 glycosylhydrolase [Saprospiraceae bacterium]|nr:family 16 glycosylhydrolase [Saprospiraceae bacterium]